MQIRLGSNQKLKIATPSGSCKLQTIDPPTPTAVARINNTYFDTLHDAVAVANSMSNASIILYKNIILDSNVTISSNVTIKGNHTLSRGNTTQSLITVASSGSLNLDENVIIDGGNNWLFKRDEFNTAQEEFVQDLTKQYSGFSLMTPQQGIPAATTSMIIVNGNLVLNSATVKNQYGRSAISVGSTGVLTINDNALITHNACSEGAAIYADTNASIVMNGGEISDSYGTANGGAIYLKGGIMTMNDGIITDNHLVGGNGVVLMIYTSPAKFIMNGGEICYNQGVCGKNSHSPCIYLHSSGVMELNGGSVHHNVGTTCGGIFVRNATTLNVNGGYVCNNENLITAHEAHQATYGGKHDIYCVGTTVVKGGSFTQDVSEYCAAGYYLKQEENGMYTCISNMSTNTSNTSIKFNLKRPQPIIGDSWE